MRPYDTPGSLFPDDELERPHPAPFPDAILGQVAQFLEPGWRVLDPFAGIGGIHRLRDTVGVDTVGVELEPEWADRHRDTICADATEIPFDPESFDAIVTSPAYGNRMADHHEAQDPSLRLTYRHALGRPLTAGNSGALQWGPEYRELHAAVWARAVSWLRPGGLFVLNIKDHIRKGRRVPVSAWHAGQLLKLGLELVDCVPVNSSGNGFTQHWEQRVDAELVWCFRRSDDA